jgi:hypothetical protein
LVYEFVIIVAVVVVAVADEEFNGVALLAASSGDCISSHSPPRAPNVLQERHPRRERVGE